MAGSGYCCRELGLRREVRPGAEVVRQAHQRAIRDTGAFETPFVSWYILVTSSVCGFPSRLLQHTDMLVYGTAGITLLLIVHYYHSNGTLLVHYQ